MSRRPLHYPAPMSAPRAYFLQDEDFSEGETEAQYAWQEGAGPSVLHDNMVPGPASDVTELYRRKPEDQYVVSQEVVMSDEPRYYYRPAALARLPQRRLPVAVTPSIHGGAQPGPHPGAYFPPPHEEPSRMQYEGMMYRSSPHLHRVADGRALSPSTGRVMRRPQQHIPDPNPQVSNLVRTIRPPTAKPGISVPTPRFYRRASVYKRPSTLCLQLPSSPDPARPIKTRLPSTMPGLSIPPLSLRSAHAPHYQSQQQMTALERARANAARSEQTEMEERMTGRRARRQLTARSAPPRCEEDLQRMMHHEFGDESGSNAGDPDPKCSELELLLNQYEQIFSSGVSKPQSASRRSSTRSRTKRKASSGRLAGLMKPRLPPSLKKRTSSRSSLKQQASSSAEEDRLEIEQMTAEVLDNLLQDLSAGGLAGDAQPSKPISRVASKAGSRPESRAVSARGKPKSVKETAEKRSSKNLSQKKSEQFNFTEIKPKESFEEIPTKTTFMLDKEKFSKFSNSSHTSFEQDKHSPERQSRDPIAPFVVEDDKDNTRVSKKSKGEDSGSKEGVKKPPWSPTKKGPKHDDHAALELHKSKSYIVNLIDRALSRELGTIPEERTSKQYLNLDARTAMDLISSKNMDTDMCLEITQAIADSLSSVQNKDTSPNNVLNPTPCCSTKAPDSVRGEPSKPDGELQFSTGNEEPLYIKQLKKLRWGHLKHIQREMRRLEDLERFLDSCSSDK